MRNANAEPPGLPVGRIGGAAGSLGSCPWGLFEGSALIRYASNGCISSQVVVGNKVWKVVRRFSKALPEPRKCNSEKPWSLRMKKPWSHPVISQSVPARFALTAALHGPTVRWGPEHPWDSMGFYLLEEACHHDGASILE